MHLSSLEHFPICVLSIEGTFWQAELWRVAGLGFCGARRFFPSRSLSPEHSRQASKSSYRRHWVQQAGREISIHEHVYWNSNFDDRLSFADHGKQTSVIRFHLQQKNGSLCIYAAVSHGNRAIFLNPFTFCTSFKRKFVVCPSADEETNVSYPSAKGINGLAHLWKSTFTAASATGTTGKGALHTSRRNRS